MKIIEIIYNIFNFNGEPLDKSNFMRNLLRNYWVARIALIFLLFSAMVGCSDNSFSDRNIEIKALKITNILNDSSIKIFKDWNYNRRQGADFWFKISGGSPYTCIYPIGGDANHLRISQPGNFFKDFPCSYQFDSSKYQQFDLIKYNAGRITAGRIIAVDNNGHDRILENNIEFDSLFRKADPFKKFAELTGLKDSLDVFEIFSRRDIGNFVEFRLWDQHILTYLPDDANINPKCKDVWIKEFATGKTIKKNWNLRKIHKPTSQR